MNPDSEQRIKMKWEAYTVCGIHGKLWRRTKDSQSSISPPAKCTSQTQFSASKTTKSVYASNV